MRFLLILILSQLGLLGASFNTVLYDSSTKKIVPSSMRFSQTEMGNTTNIVMDWNTNYYRATPSNNFVISWVNAPSSSSTYAYMVLELINTNSTSGYFPTNGPNFSSPFLSSSPSTNWFTFRYNGSTFWIDSHQEISLNLTTKFVATNDTANSNITVSMDIPTETIFATNNLSLTNITGLLAGTSKNKVLYLKPQLVNRTLVLPSLGAPSFGTYLYTNSNSQIWTTITNGRSYILTLDAEGTNIYTTISEWK